LKKEDAKHKMDLRALREKRKKLEQREEEVDADIEK